MGIHKLLASKDASKKKAHGTQENKRSNGRRAKKRQRFLKIVLEVGGEENKRRMANNVMRGRRVYDGYLVWLDLA